MTVEKDYIALYRTLLEEKLLLGNIDGKLKQRDFEYLAELIEEKSHIKLSISTLKRLWKDDFTQVPHPRHWMHWFQSWITKTGRTSKRKMPK